jgi:tetratricopeptide (TPR) repeat protein
VYAALGRPRAQRLHAQIAAALERAYGERAPSHADELAYHFSRAGASAPHRKALGYLAESGRRALERHADRAAATYLASALDQLDADGANGVTVRMASRHRPCAPRCSKGWPARGSDSASMASRALWLRLERDAERSGDWRTVAMVERRVGLMHAAGGRHDRAIERFDAGIAAAARASDDALATRIRLARAISLQAIGRRDEARGDVHAALDSAVALGDESLLARVHRAMLLLHLWTGPVADARSHGERAVMLAAESKERLLEWSAHWAMAILGGLTGDAASTAHHVRESERLAGEIGSPCCGCGPTRWRSNTWPASASGRPRSRAPNRRSRRPRARPAHAAGARARVDGADPSRPRRRGSDARAHRGGVAAGGRRRDRRRFRSTCTLSFPRTPGCRAI